MLTGGSSRRMGRRKADIELDGVAMAERVALALRAAGAVAVARIGDEVPDRHPRQGPLGGVLTALAWSAEAVTVVAPCDLLDPSADAFRWLVDALLGGEALAALAGVDQPLPIALRAAAAVPLQARFDAGERAIRAAVASLPVATASLPPAALADADTPEDLPPGAR